MNGLVPLLLVVVALTNYAYEPLAEFYADPRAAARAIFYIARGVEGVALYAVIWRLAYRGPRAYRLGVGMACGWGILESGQTAVCRAALGIATVPAPSAYHGVCDVVTGLPVYGLTALFALVVAAFSGDSNNEQGT